MRLKKMMALLTAALMALVVAAPALAQDGEAQVRVAHLSPDAPAVDVYVNDAPVDALIGVPFGTISAYLPLPAGSQNVKVYASGDTSAPVLEADVDLADGQAYTIGAVGLVGDGSLAAQVYEDDVSAPAEGSAKLRVVHASPDAGPVDVAPQGADPLVSGLEFPNASEYAEVPADTYTIDVLAAGTDTVALTVPDLALSADTTYTAFATGLAADGSLQVIPAVDSTAGEATMTMPDTGGSTLPVQLAVLTAAFVVGVSAAGLYALKRRTA